MTVEIRVCPPDRFTDLLRTAEIGFGEDVADDLIERVKAVSDPARFVCALDGDRIVGTGGAFTMTLRVPGGDLPAGGVTWVTVLPSHRRRGILRGMMRLMVDDCHSRGEPLAMLWASEGAIYQRFGYGMATVCANLEADTRASKFTRDWPVEGRYRLIPAGQGREIVEPVYEAARAQNAGFLSRPPEWWVGQLPLAEKDAKGGEAKRLVVYETDRGAEAYAVYKTKAVWDGRGPGGTITVEEAIASTPAGTRAIWRYLFDVDLVRTLKTWRLPADHPVLSLVAEPRRLGITMGDGLWLRIVDVTKALEGRTYGPAGQGSGRLTMELRDEYCPWNAGRWTLEVDGGRGRLTQAVAEPQIALDANDLGAVFLGGWRPSALARSGRVVELLDGGLAAADALFATATLPWCPQEF
jgi:predicted acetyltransferase